MELPALCFQLFSMCSTASQLIIPLLALEKYFYRNYYKRLFSDMCSNSTNLDSIGKLNFDLVLNHMYSAYSLLFRLVFGQGTKGGGGDYPASFELLHHVQAYRKALGYNAEGKLFNSMYIFGRSITQISELPAYARCDPNSVYAQRHHIDD